MKPSYFSFNIVPFLILLLFFPTILVEAQDERLPGNVVKYSLIDMATFTGSSFLISYEQPFINKFSLQLEGGYSIGPNYGFFENSNINGFKIRAEFRHYLRNKKANFHFIGLQVMYHSLSGKTVDDFCRDGCNYFQQIEYEKDFSNRGIHFIHGVSNYQGNHFILETGYFIGVRIREQYNIGIPDDAEQAGNDNTGILGEGKFVLPGIGFYVRIGFGW